MKGRERSNPQNPSLAGSLTGSFTTAIFVQNRGRGGRPTPTRAEVAHAHQTVQIAHSARGLDLDLWRTRRAHQFQIVCRGALIVVVTVRLFYETKTRGGLHPVGSGVFANLAELALETVTVQARAAFVQVIVFEDDLHFCPVPVRLSAHGFHVAFHVIPISAQRLADIDDHVDFDRAVPAGQLGFVALGLGARIAVGKSDDASDAHAASRQQFGGALDGVRFDANGGHTVSYRQSATVLQFAVRQGRMQQGMINHSGQLFVAVFHNAPTLCQSTGNVNRRCQIGREALRRFPNLHRGQGIDKALPCKIRTSHLSPPHPGLNLSVPLCPSPIDSGAPIWTTTRVSRWRTPVNCPSPSPRRSCPTPTSATACLSAACLPPPMRSSLTPSAWTLPVASN